MKKLNTHLFKNQHIIRFYDAYLGSYLFQDEQHQLYFANFANFQNNPEISTYVYLPITNAQRKQFENNQLSIRQLYKSCQNKPIYIDEVFTDSNHPDELSQTTLAEIDKDWLPDPDSYLY